MVLTCVLACLLVLLSFAGGLHRAFDTLGLGLPIYLGVLLLLLPFFWRRRGVATVLTMFLVVGGARVVGVFLAGDDVEDGLRLYSKNLLAVNDHWQGIATDVLEQDVDVVLLQEISVYNQEILTALEATFPHQHVCPFSNWSAMAVLSRVDFADTPICSSRRAMAAAPLQFGEEVAWFVSVHIPWHWPRGDARHEEAARALLDALEGPVVLAGDFNSFPWTHRVVDLMRRAGSQHVGPTRATYWIRGVPLFLDHVAVPSGWAGELTYRPFLGADHLGVVAEVRP